MQKLLFVCLGNICRSPLAEGIMLHLNEQKNLGLTIDSAGIAGFHIGETPDSRTIANARKNGVDLSALRARQFSAKDLDEFDLILAMDRSNYNNVLKLATSEVHRRKVRLFLEYSTGSAGAEVPDPYYGSEKDFENVFQLVYKACEHMCAKLDQPIHP